MNELKMKMIPGETPAAQLRRFREERPDIKSRLRYIPHQGAKQRAKNLARLAASRGTEVADCHKCKRAGLLDAMVEREDGYLYCAECATAQL